MLPVPLFGRDSSYMYIKQRAVGCGVKQGWEKGPWKTVLVKKVIRLPNNPSTSSIHLSPTLTPMPCPTWAWLVNAWVWSTVLKGCQQTLSTKSKASLKNQKRLSLHKHESNGGGGLRWMWASSDIPQWFLHTNCVVVYPSAFAVKFKCHLVPSEFTLIYFIPLHRGKTGHVAAVFLKT